MNLFFKIFLWFLAAIALMVGIVVFINWSIQTEPVVSRWQISVRNQMTIYAETASQIFEYEGEAGLRLFLNRIRNSETVSEVGLIGRDDSVWLGDVTEVGNYDDLIERSFASGGVEIDSTQPDTSLAAKQISLPNGQSYALVVRWDRPRPVAIFGESRLRYLRVIGLFLTALAVCYALARYLTSPIGKINAATHKLADGDLKTRVADQVGRRRDELSQLARDFDLMAERIESLVTSQQRLTRDISHELRSPLARMNVALEIAKQKSSGDAAPLLQRIETESNRLNEMIAQLLTLSRLESGSRNFERENVDLAQLVAQIAEDAGFEAEAQGKAVKFEGSGTCVITGSESLIWSAIENVVRNAVRYTRPGTSVEVSLNKRGKSAVVKVEDRGGGVPEAEIKNLFRPFYRVGEARERSTGGIGLGLAIAEQAIKAHNGTIAAYNRAEGLVVEIVLDCESV